MGTKWAWCWMLAAGLLLHAMTAVAAVPEAVRDKIEVSMLLTGSVDVASDGSVTAYAIDRRDVVPEPVLAFVDRNLPAWQFAPIRRAGETVAVRARLSLRVVARPVDGDVFRMSIAGVSVEVADRLPTDELRGRHLKPPQYPPEVGRIGGKGMVYLVLRVNREGRVEDSFVEQVNLTVAGTEAEMERIRVALGQASLEGARKWRFRPPTTGGDAQLEGWAARVPVAFSSYEPAYGTWGVYLPGPRAVEPWADDGAAADAAASGQIRLVGSGMRLLTPLPEG